MFFARRERTLYGYEQAEICTLDMLLIGIESLEHAESSSGSAPDIEKIANRRNVLKNKLEGRRLNQQIRYDIMQREDQ